jgi:hypothetical protein
LKEISLKQGEAEEGEDLSLKDDSYYEGSEHNSDQESTVSLAELAKITSEASAKKVGMAKTIKPGDWISYQSKVTCTGEDNDNHITASSAITYISIAYLIMAIHLLLLNPARYSKIRGSFHG